MKKVVDLFAGCGGMSLGFQKAGYEIVGAFENWGKAADCHEANFAHPVFRDDLADVENAVKKISELNPDVIIGSPPCQDNSLAGKQEEGERAALTKAFAEIVVGVNPKWFIMENVDRIVKVKCGRVIKPQNEVGAYAAARQLFKDASYGLTEVVLTASFYGVPQRRKRFFCIGALGADDGFLTEYIESNTGTTETTLRNYFGNSLGIEHYYAHPRSYKRRAVFSIDEPSATIRGMNTSRVAPGYPGHKGDACKLNDTLRSLTTEERAQVQTFPANFYWVGSDVDKEQMIGNAVPVKLSEFVAGVIAHHISSTENSI